MSAGKSSSSSKQRMDPQIKAALLDVYEQGKQLAYTPYNPYQFATVAPMSPLEMQGMQASADAAQSGVGQQQIQDAIAAARGVAQYQPGAISGRNVRQQGPITGVNPTEAEGQRDASATQLRDTFGVSPAEAERARGMGRFDGLISGGSGDRISDAIIAPGAANITAPTIDAGPGVTEDRVSAGQFADTNINPYMSQFQTGVIDAALGDIERQRKIQQNKNAAAAVAGGAFGGDRQAILEAETNRAALEQSARTAAQLRQSGFESAARLAEADLARQSDAARANQQAALQADLANQAAGLDASKAGGQLGLQAQTTAAQLGMQGALAAQDANLRRQLANQQVSVGDAERAMQASSTMAANELQNRQQELQRRMSNAAQANEIERANLNARLQGDQLGAQQARANQQAALQAELANQQNQRLYGFQNQDANMQGQLANQATALEQARLDQARRLANQQARFQRQLAQQELGLQGAQQRLAGARQLGALGQDLRGMQFADAEALRGVGTQQRQFAQQLLDDQYRRFQEAQNYPFRMFDVLRSGAGMLPSPTLSKSSGSSTSLGLV